jgi:S1-C subfamily serine protease
MRTALVALLAGLVSAIAVAALILGTGIGDDDDGGDTTAPARATGAAPAPSTGDVFRQATRGIVRVDARPPGTRIPSGPPREDDGVATGTGFVIDRDGSIITNDHVAEGGSEVSVRFGEDDRRIDARVIGRDPSTDLALLRIDPGRAGDFTALPLGKSGDVRVGDTAIAIGHPFGLERTLTVGVVSSTGRNIDAPNGAEIADAVQTDAAVNPGNSGGPLLDSRGRVIGVNSQGRGEGIAFAVSVDTLKRVLPALRRGRGRRIPRPFLGVSTGGDGRRVVEVVPDEAADDAGIREGDVIVSVDGRPARGPGDVARAVQRRKPGDRVVVVVRRDGREVTARVVLGTRR